MRKSKDDVVRRYGEEAKDDKMNKANTFIGYNGHTQIHVGRHS